ncbi:MAG: hypothetical protein AB1633_12915, partial [Elusimicrobiota bacterium]
MTSLKGSLSQRKNNIEIDSIKGKTRCLDFDVTGTFSKDVFFNKQPKEKGVDSFRLYVYNIRGDLGKELSWVVEKDFDNPENSVTVFNFLKEGTTFPIEGRLQFLGSFAAPVLNSGIVNITSLKDKKNKNKLICKRLFDKIDDFKGHIVIDQCYAEIKLEGKVKGRTLQIIGQKSKEGLEPLIIRNIGLNLGILNLIVDKRGVEVSIPGFMYNTEYGYVALDGKEKGEKFTLSGPLEKPLFKGKMVLNNLSFTFPLLKKGVIKYDKKFPEIELDMDIVTQGGLKYFLFNSGQQINNALENIRKGEYGSVLKDFLINIRNEITLNIPYIEISKRSKLHLSGSFIRGDEKIEGYISSNTGVIEYLSQEYDVYPDDVELVFIPETDKNLKRKFNNAPLIRGRAYLKGDIERRKEIRLYMLDKFTGQMVLYGRLSKEYLILPKEYGEGMEGRESDIIKNKVMSLGFDSSMTRGFANLARVYGLKMSADYVNAFIIGPIEDKIIEKMRIGELGINQIGLKVNETRLMEISNELIRENVEHLTFQQLLRLAEIRARVDLP